LPATRLPARPTFVFAGRLEKPKGILELVDEFRALPHYDLIVAGDGALRPEFLRRTAGATNIHLPGWLPKHELVRLFTSAHAAIFPFLGPESFGAAVVEALSCGTPVVVRSVGASGEIVTRSDAGFIYQSNAELRTILAKLTSPTLRASLSSRARQAYLDHYTPERYLTAYLNLIGDIAARKKLSI
jgi:glycosyltransferase involved in cell wall biosynthesis